MKRRDGRNNHANQMNPNNYAYWQSRGYDKRPTTGRAGCTERNNRFRNAVATVPGARR